MLTTTAPLLVVAPKARHVLFRSAMVVTSFEKPPRVVSVAEEVLNGMTGCFRPGTKLPNQRHKFCPWSCASLMFIIIIAALCNVCSGQRVLRINSGRSARYKKIHSIHSPTLNVCEQANTLSTTARQLNSTATCHIIHVHICCAALPRRYAALPSV